MTRLYGYVSYAIDQSGTVTLYNNRILNYFILSCRYYYEIFVRNNAIRWRFLMEFLTLNIRVHACQLHNHNSHKIAK